MSRRLDGEWLNARLREVGSSRAGLSRALGKDRSAVTRLVQGERQLQLREVAVVAAHLKCPKQIVTVWAGVTDDNGGDKGGFGEMEQPALKPENRTPGPAHPSRSEKGQHPAIGALKGMITLLPDVDYARPADPDWGKVYEN